MKKLLILLLATVTVIAFALPPFRIYNPTIMQRAGLDSLSITINDSDSVDINTSKAFVSLNKPVKVNGDSLPTISRVKELIGDSMQTITGFVDLTSEQTITGIKTFSDTLTAPIIKTSTLYSSLSYPIVVESFGDIEYRGRSGINFINLYTNEMTMYNYDGNTELLYSSAQYNKMSNPRGNEIILADTSFTKIFTPRTGLAAIDITDTTLIINNPRTTNAIVQVMNDGNEIDYYDHIGNQFFVASGETEAEFMAEIKYNGNSFIEYNPTTTTISRGDTTFITMADTTIRAQKNLVAPKFYVSALNEAPASATAEGTTGEIRITTGYIYVCVSDDVWVRTELTTWP